jgi:hypothetical protein
VIVFADLSALRTLSAIAREETSSKSEHTLTTVSAYARVAVSFGGVACRVAPQGTPPSLVAPKAAPLDPPRIIKVPSQEAMSRELNQPERREFRLELAESKRIVRSPAAGR